jgi:hypothetical protein
LCQNVGVVDHHGTEQGGRHDGKCYQDWHMRLRVSRFMPITSFPRLTRSSTAPARARMRADGFRNLNGRARGRRTRNTALRGEAPLRAGSIVRWPSLLDNARPVAQRDLGTQPDDRAGLRGVRGQERAARSVNGTSTMAAHRGGDARRRAPLMTAATGSYLCQITNSN